MEKDFDLKNDPQYQTSHLRERINDSIKRIRDETREVKESQAKRMSPRNRSKRYKSDWNKNDL